MNSVICLLERAAARWPERIAVEDEQQSLTYRALREKARRAASGLLRTGSSHAPVMVYLPKSADMLIGFGAAMYAGRPYVPTDAAAPAQRLQKILSNLQPSAILTNRQLGEGLAELDLAGVPVLYIDELTQCAEDAAAVDEAVARVTDADPVYVMYTSGSTGEPKGVTIPHRGVLLFARWAEKTFGWDCETVIANQAPLYFDVSVMDVYGAMRCGGKLILTPEVLFRFPNKLPEFLQENAVTSIYWVPTVMINIANSGALDGVTLPCLKSVAFAGEVMPNLQLNIWRRALPGRIFANLYGPTETDVCTAYVVDRDFADGDPLPIGKPLPNMKVLLLGEDGMPVKTGETGEICVAGSGVNIGYWNRPDLTERAFTTDPRNTAWQERYYRTGDLGWYNEYGEIMFAGRRDGQIKLRGNRIELGEVENAARLLPGVENVCVIFDRTRQEIVLFLETAQEIPLRTARREMRGTLPAYMMPGRIVCMEQLPHNANDKIDRVSLTKWLEEN